MIIHPFTLLTPFKDKIDVRFLTKEDDAKNDADIARASGAQNLVSIHQMHGADTVIVREPSSRMLKADGLATDKSGLSLVIRFADCQSLLIYSRKHRVVGLAHAGWRGIVAGVIPNFFRQLKSEWNIGASDVIVGMGPSLCMKCAEFTDPEKEVPSLAQFTMGRCVDLQAAADNQLIDAGVQMDQIERLPQCTRCKPDIYWTYRGGHREEVKEGYTNSFVVTLIS